MFSIQLCLFALATLLHKGKADSANVIKETRDLFDDYWRWRLHISPTSATSSGYREPQYMSRIPEVTEDSIQVWKLMAERFLKRANDIQDEELDSDNKFSLDILKAEISIFLEGLPMKGYLLEVMTNFHGGPLHIPSAIDSVKPETEEDYKHLLSRLLLVPKYIDEHIDLMRKGLQIGYLQSPYAMKGVANQIKRIVEGNKAFKKPFTNVTEDIPEEKRKEIQGLAFHVIEHITYPSLLKLGEFYEQEYMKLSREDAGVWSLPNGQEFYQQILRFYTTTNFTAEEIHEMGKQETERLRDDIREVIELMGYENITIREFAKIVGKNESNFFNSSDEMLSTYQDIVHKVIPPNLSKVFWKTPKQKVLVEKLDGPGAAAFYVRGSSKTGRPGKFVIPMGSAKSGARYLAVTLALHEACPGHHFQIASMEENENLPDFRRRPFGILAPPSDFPSYHAFIEGWGLYAETLGFDMGLFEENLMDRYGHYVSSLFRAVRLVVDTGLHAFGWSREKAVEYLLDNTSMGRYTIESEVNRYITIPGQACSYKVGELKFRQLRRRAEQSLEEAFDIRDFHQTVLSCVGPLDIVEECVNKYIEKKLKEKLEEKIDNIEPI